MTEESFVILQHGKPFFVNAVQILLSLFSPRSLLKISFFDFVNDSDTYSLSLTPTSRLLKVSLSS